MQKISSQSPVPQELEATWCDGLRTKKKRKDFFVQCVIHLLNQLPQDGCDRQ